MRFEDRRDAGKRLAQRLVHLGRDEVIVLGLPRGGVPVAFEVARALGAPLDVLVARKLGAPNQPELGLGAIAPDGVRVLDEILAREVGATGNEIAAVEAEERKELERRVRAYRGGRAPPDVRGRTAVLVDDGLATGGTMRAAVQWARIQGARRVVAATPVGPPETVELLRREADEVVVVEAPPRLGAVGLWYRDFAQTTDDEVILLLERARESRREVSAWP